MMDFTDKEADLERDGYIAVADLLTDQEVAWYRARFIAAAWFTTAAAIPPLATAGR